MPVSAKKCPGGKISSRSSESGGGEKFLLQDCIGRARVKVAFFSQTPVRSHAGRTGASRFLFDIPEFHNQHLVDSARITFEQPLFVIHISMYDFTNYTLLSENKPLNLKTISGQRGVRLEKGGCLGGGGAGKTRESWGYGMVW